MEKITNYLLENYETDLKEVHQLEALVILLVAMLVIYFVGEVIL